MCWHPLTALELHFGVSSKNSDEKESPAICNILSATYIYRFSCFLEAELVRGRYRNALFHGKQLTVWLGGQGPGMKMTGELVTRRSGKSSVVGSLPKGVVCVLCECPPKKNLSRGEF